MSTPVPDRRTCRINIQDACVEVVTDDDQLSNATIINESLDGLGLCCPKRVNVKPGSDIMVNMGGIHKSAMVQHADWIDKQFRIGLQWKSSYFRDKARLLLDNTSEVCAFTADADARSRFEKVLPSALYSLWQLLEGNKPLVFADTIEQFVRAARVAGIDLGEASERLTTVAHDGNTSAARSALTVLCEECLQNLIQSDKPVIVEQIALADTAPNTVDLLGAPGWTVGTVACLAGRLLLFS